MEKSKVQELLGFYENELVRNILFFWDEKCIDTVHGGYFNCFDNRGDALISHDKYTWSQGRFVWLWSKLAAMDCGTFTASERADFLANAAHGAEFLMRHCLLAPDDWRCVFLMDESGTPKTVPGWGDRLDLSLAADSFVVSGLAKFALTANREDCYTFAKNLYVSIIDRYERNDFQNLPYPLNPAYHAHGKPMGFSNIAKELYEAACLFDPAFAEVLKGHLRKFTEDILTNFVDENYALREVVRMDGTHLSSLLGQHMNPGHTIEGMWFMIDAMDITRTHGRAAERGLLCDQPGETDWLKSIAQITWKALKNGWDEEYGGLLHYCAMDGGEPVGDTRPDENEPMTQQVLSGWGDKLWWIHSEALYTTMLLYARTEDETFWEWNQRIFRYTFEKFPNPNREVREWIQILKRDGTPQDKVVALPVKDPYHIMRNMILMVELLYTML